MIDVKVLRAAGLSDSQIVALLEAEQEADRSIIERRRQMTAERVRRLREKRRNASNALHALQHEETSDDSMNGNALHCNASNALHRDSLREDSSKRRKDSFLQNGLGEAFATFWASYPRKTGKKPAARAFASAMKETTIETIMAAIEQQKPALLARGDPNLIPEASSWLNKARWQDDQSLFTRPKFADRIV